MNMELNLLTVESLRSIMNMQTAQMRRIASGSEVPMDDAAASPAAKSQWDYALDQYRACKAELERRGVVAPVDEVANSTNQS